MKRRAFSLSTLLMAMASAMCFSTVFAAGITVDGELADWTTIFDADGSVRKDASGVPDFVALYGGSDANFVWDDVYTGANQETTAFSPGNTRPIDRAAIAAEHDVARSYFYVEPNASGNKLYYAGIERVSAGGNSYVEVEFNQRLHRLGHGRPWKVVGKRSSGDLLVRVEFSNGVINSALVQRATIDPAAEDPTWEIVASLASEGCDGFALCVSMNTATIAGGGPWSGYDDANPEQPGPGVDLPPGAFLELSVDVDAISGPNVNFASACVITPMDVGFGYFGEVN